MGRRLNGAVIAAISWLAFASPTLAQTSVLGNDKADLREEQRIVFGEMFERPDDLSLMFRYALVSIRLEDLEAAISTLERMLIYNKALPRVHMELGAAYYRLGSYETAKYYFKNVLDFDDVPAEVVAKAKEFLRAIAQRTEKSVFVGSVSAGFAYASNATLGPDDPTVELFGNPNFVLDDDSIEDDDFGFRSSASLSHFYDLEQADSDFWRTDLSVFNLHYFQEHGNDIDSVQLRSGPQVSLDDRQFGPKIRPFAEFDFVRSGNEFLYATIGGGVDFTDTLSDTLSVFGTARIGYRNYTSGRNDFDAWVMRATGGVAYIPHRTTVLRGAFFLERNQADEDVNSFIEATARLSATYSYDSDFDFADRLWSATAFAQFGHRAFDEPTTFNPDRKRRDYDLRFGGRHTFYLEDGLWIALDADFLTRDSNVDLFKIDNFGGALSVGFDF